MRSWWKKRLLCDHFFHTRLSIIGVARRSCQLVISDFSIIVSCQINSFQNTTLLLITRIMTEKGKKSFKSKLKNLAKPLNNHRHWFSLIWNDYEQKIECDSGFDLLSETIIFNNNIIITISRIKCQISSKLTIETLFWCLSY